MWLYNICWSIFKAAVKKVLNCPVIIADRFYYCRYIHWAGDKVRRKVQRKWHAYDRKKIKSCVFDYSNGFLEGIYNTSKVMKRVGVPIGEVIEVDGAKTPLGTEITRPIKRM